MEYYRLVQSTVQHNIALLCTVVLQSSCSVSVVLAKVTGTLGETGMLMEFVMPLKKSLRLT